MTYSRILVVIVVVLYLIASCDGRHGCGRGEKQTTLTPDHLVVLAISHTSIQYMDFIEILNVPLDLSTTYFAHVSGCWASSVYSSYCILDCYNLFSGVKSSIRSFCFISIYDRCDTPVFLLFCPGISVNFCTGKILSVQ